ncbi:MAG: DUF2569 domain-containing protein [Rhizobacter sp.]
MSDQRYLPPQASVEAIAPSPETPAHQAEPIDIGGWLILVAIGLIVTPFRVVHLMFNNHWPIFRDGHWDRLTNPDSPAYHVLWAPILTYEIVGNFFLMTLAGITLALFFKKSRKTPRFAIIWYAFGPIFLLIDEVLGSFIPAVAAAPDASNLRELIRATIIAAIWIPYFLLSKRVKQTFTR